MEFTYIDYIIIAVIAVSIITGIFRGFLKELIALVVWALAIWVGYTYSLSLSNTLTPYIGDPTIRTGASFIGIMIAVLVIGGTCNAILSFIIKRSGLSSTDRLLGMGFGFVRGVFVVSLGLMIIKLTSLPYKKYHDESKVVASFEPVVNWMSGFVPGVLSKIHELDPAKNTETAQLKHASNDFEIIKETDKIYQNTINLDE